jgi:hypothetical protein
MTAYCSVIRGAMHGHGCIALILHDVTGGHGIHTLLKYIDVQVKHRSIVLLLSTI